MGRQKNWSGAMSRRPRQFSDAEVRRMVDRRADGVTLEAIARTFGTSPCKVRTLVRAAQATPAAKTDLKNFARSPLDADGVPRANA
jgi:hypothetical protein